MSEPSVNELAKWLAALPPKQSAALLKVAWAKTLAIGVCLNAGEVSGLMEFLTPHCADARDAVASPPCPTGEESK